MKDFSLEERRASWRKWLHAGLREKQKRKPATSDRAKGEGRL